MPFFLLAPLAWIGEQLFVALAWFVSRGGIRFVAMTALIAVIGTAIFALVSFTDNLLGGVLPASATFVVAFLPDNTALCISSIISCQLACTGYKLSVKLAEMKARIFVA